MAAALVIVLRHGERVDAVNNTMEADTSITPAGRADVARVVAPILRKSIQGLCADAASTAAAAADAPPVVHVSVVSSPFARCLQTAEALCDCSADWAGFELPETCRSVDTQLAEVFGPQRIKGTDAGPPLASSQICFRGARVVQRCPGRPTTGGARAFSNEELWPLASAEKEQGKLAPTEWGEDIPTAHRRLAQCLRDHAAKARAEAIDAGAPRVRVLVTHGDALQATVAAVHPGRVVYDCQYLGLVVFEPTRDNDDCLSTRCRGRFRGCWQIQAAEGVSWFDDETEMTTAQRDADGSCSDDDHVPREDSGSSLEHVSIAMPADDASGLLTPQVKGTARASPTSATSSLNMHRYATLAEAHVLAARPRLDGAAMNEQQRTDLGEGGAADVDMDERDELIAHPCRSDRLNPLLRNPWLRTLLHAVPPSWTALSAAVLKHDPTLAAILVVTAVVCRIALRVLLQGQEHPAPETPAALRGYTQPLGRRPRPAATTPGQTSPRAALLRALFRTTMSLAALGPTIAIPTLAGYEALGVVFSSAVWSSAVWYVMWTCVFLSEVLLAMKVE